MSSRADHMTTENVYRQLLALWLGNGDEHCPLESDTTGQFVKGNLFHDAFCTDCVELEF